MKVLNNMNFKYGLKNNFVENFQNLDKNRKNDTNILNSNENNKNTFQKINLKKSKKYMSYSNELNKHISSEKNARKYFSNNKLNNFSSLKNRDDFFNVVDKKINKIHETEHTFYSNNINENCLKKKSYINELNSNKFFSNMKDEYKHNKFTNKQEKIPPENSKSKEIKNLHNFTEKENIMDIKICETINNRNNTIDKNFNNRDNKDDGMSNRFKNSFMNIENNKNICSTDIYKNNNFKLNSYNKNSYKVNNNLHYINNNSYDNRNTKYFNSYNRINSFKKSQNIYKKNKNNDPISNDENNYNKNIEGSSGKNTDNINKRNYFNKNYNRNFYNYNLNESYFSHNVKVNMNKNNNFHLRYRKGEFNKTYCDKNYLNKNVKDKNKNLNNFNTNENSFNENKNLTSDNNINEKFEEHFNCKNETYINESSNCNYSVASNVSYEKSANKLSFKKEKEIKNLENECMNVNTNENKDIDIKENKNENIDSNENENVSENKEINKSENEVNKKIENECNKKSEILSEETFDNMNEELKKRKREEEKKKIMNWTSEEQTLLEEGLRVYKNLKNCPEKWIKISEIVKSKSPDDCLKRFLYCRSIVLKEKEKMKKEMEQMNEKKECETDEYKEKSNNEIKSNRELEQDIDSDDMNINNNMNIKGKSLLLNNVQLKNISMYKAVLLKLQLVCTRCCNTFEITSTTKDDSQLICNCVNCCNSAVIEIYRNICFLENSCICVLKFNQCSLMDLLTADYSMNCENCGRKSVFKNVTSGKEINANCQNCFTKLEFKYKDFSFDETISANNATIKKIDDMINKLFTKKKSNKKALSTSNNLKIEKCKNIIKINNIEVNNGACKHFKKSHRLFKFPCCNKIFPCPTCHDLNSNHECDIARRIICGFCYREFSDDEVCICQKEKKIKKSGKYWEGGKGCRNAITLSKNDSKKYKLLNRQTTQKKKKK